MKTLNKVIFNSSKIGWVHVNVAEIIRLFEMSATSCFSLNEEDIIENYDLKTFKSLTESYKEISLYNLCIYSICNELKIFKTELDVKQHKPVIEKWFSIATKVIDYLIPIFNSNNFSACIVFHGHMVLDGCLLELSKLYQVPYLCIEATANQERIVWDDLSGKVITYNLAKSYFYKYCNLISLNDANRYSDFFKNNIFSKKRDEHISQDQGNIDKLKKPFILFVAQVYNDASQLFTLGDTIKNPVEVIESVVDEAAKIGYDVFIKLHPKEHKGKNPITKTTYDLITYNRIRKLESENVRIDYNNSYNTFELIKKSKLVVTVNSQAGLESSLFNKPVISYYHGFYSNIGFTYDYSTINELRHAIIYVISNNITENRNLNAASVFYYIFYEKYCIVRSAKSLVDKSIEIGSFKKNNKFIDFLDKVKRKINV